MLGVASDIILESGIAGQQAEQIIIRKARVKDVPQVFKLVNQMARIKGNMLPRSMWELYEHVRDFVVAVDGDRVMGTCSLHIFWEDLAEVRSLAVDNEYQGQGWGEQLMRVIIQDAKEVGILRLFTLTTIPAFFEKFGFQISNKDELHQKTWSECHKCPKFTSCDETALVLDVAPGYTGPKSISRALNVIP